MDMEGHIPVNLDDLPIDTIQMDESLVYKGELTRITLSPKPSKNNMIYCAIGITVTEGDFEGKTATSNYLPIPVSVPENATKKERIQILDNNQTFMRFVRSFGIGGKMPPVWVNEVGGVDTDALQTWNDWASTYKGHSCRGFTIRNQEFPEGSGRLRPNIVDFVL